MKKWITPALIIVGAILLFGASRIDSGLTTSSTIWFKIAGLLAIFLGIYRATKVVKTYSENENNDDTEGGQR